MTDKKSFPPSNLFENLRSLPTEDERPYNFFSADGPDLKDLAEMKSLIHFFGVNWRNLILHGIYIVIFLTLTFFALRWVTQGFKNLNINAVGWLVVAVPFCGILLSTWRVFVEEIVRIPYNKYIRLHVDLKISRAKIIDLSLPVNLGGRLGCRRIIWEDPSTGFSGVSPYLPGSMIHRLKIGSEVWIAVDSKNRIGPLLVGAKK